MRVVNVRGRILYMYDNLKSACWPDVILETDSDRFVAILKTNISNLHGDSQVKSFAKILMPDGSLQYLRMTSTIFEMNDEDL